MVQPDTGGNYAMVHYCLFVQDEEACSHRYSSRTDNDVCVCVVHFHFADDARNGEPSYGLSPRWGTHAAHCRGRTFQGEKVKV